MDVSLAALEVSYRYSHQGLQLRRSASIVSSPAHVIPKLMILTAAARSNMAFPAIKASSWLSLISIFMTWTGLLKSPPRERRSTRIHTLAMCSMSHMHLQVSPSQTASKHLSSQVMTTSATVLFSCHLSGANLMRRFLSSICRSPFAVYLAPNLRCCWRTRPKQPLTVEDPLR